MRMVVLPQMKAGTPSLWQFLVACLGNFCENLQILSSLGLKKLLQLSDVFSYRNYVPFSSLTNFNFFSGFLNPCKLLPSTYTSTALDSEETRTHTYTSGAHLVSCCPDILLEVKPGPEQHLQSWVDFLSHLYSLQSVVSCLYPLSLYYLGVSLIFYWYRSH